MSGNARRACASVRQGAAGVTHRAVVGVDGVVGLPIFRVLELAVDETLVGHLHRHVVHLFAHLDANRNVKLGVFLMLPADPEQRRH